MISIALCITDLNVGGAERCLVELAARLDRNRFTPVVYCLSAAPRPGETTFIPALESAGLASRVMPEPGFLVTMKKLRRVEKPVKSAS